MTAARWIFAVMMIVAGLMMTTGLVGCSVPSESAPDAPSAPGFRINVPSNVDVNPSPPAVPGPVQVR